MQIPLVVGSSNLSDTSVGGHDDNRSSFAFKGSVQEGEAFNIKHMDFINKQDTRNNFSLSFFSPFSYLIRQKKFLILYLLIDLISNFLLDFTSVTGEQGKETLRSAVDNINFVKGNSVNNFLSLLEFSFRALDESSLRSSSIVVRSSGKGSS